ncbi:hypothetical protein [Geobacter sp.]|uniref:hypothetical protein n=1 Tax=Geobacter sp. TaxID=46610 RepID=UPI002608E4FE|nr:hypothetical protein [Geobacter sp.]
MGKGILADIVRLEEEIHRRLEGERQRAAALVAEARRERDGAVAAEEARLREELDRAVAAAREGALREAQAREREAEARGARLAALDDGFLRERVRARLAALLPGGGP